MGKLNDLTGRKYGILTVIKLSEIKNHNAYWLCQCDCGNTKIAAGYRLTNGDTRSCGCLQKDTARKLGLKKTENGFLLKISYKGLFENTRIGNLTMGIPKNNTSGYKGVYWNKKRENWKALIQLRGKSIFLGYFDKKDDAIKVRKEAEEKYFKPVIEDYKLNLDGTELYGEDGQTIADITELDRKEVLEILDIKKELPKQP